MRRLRLCLLLLLWGSVPVMAAPPDAAAWKAWIPAGWKLLSASTGDLNGDSRPDAALVLEQDSPALRQAWQGLGAAERNLNPRRLLVLLQGDKGYTRLLATDRFLPPESDEEAPCLADPLSEGGGVRIQHGLLLVDLHYWLSCGGWGVSHTSHRFRYDGGRMRLIGKDSYEFMRNSGERSETSINYLTGRQKTTTGLNEFGESPRQPRVRWTALQPGPAEYLDAMVPQR